MRISQLECKRKICGGCLLRTHEAEAIDEEAKVAFSGWLDEQHEAGLLKGIGYCPLSDDNAESRAEVYAVINEIRADCPADWLQGPRAESVLRTIEYSLAAEEARELGDKTDGG